MDDSGEILPFSVLIGGRAGPAAPKLPEGDAPDETVAPGQAFATVTGGRTAVSLEFIRRDGSSFSVPYSYHPLLWWQPPGLLLIEYPGFFSVALTGLLLAELYRRLRDRKVTWIRETGELDAPGTPCVTTMEILHSFPSREAGVKLDTP